MWQRETATILIFSIFLLIIVNTILNAGTSEPKPTLSVGYQTFTNKIKTVEGVRPLVEYLSHELPEYQFEFVPLSDDGMMNALTWSEVDFAICNPYISIFAEHLYSYSIIATLVRKWEEMPTVYQAGAIFCRSSRTDINKLKDLKGKTVAAPGKNFFAGWVLPLNELKKCGINPIDDFAALQVLCNHEEVFHAVLTGQADVGFISAFYLWEFVNKNEMKEGDIKVINIKESNLVPYLHSTDVYPETYWIAHPAISEDIRKKIAIALLKISPESPEAQCLDSYGWCPPLNYASVEALIQNLHLPPFEKIEREPFIDFVKRNKYPLTVFLIFWTLFIISIISVVYIYRSVRTNRMLQSLLYQSRAAQKQLEDSERRYRLLTENYPGAVYICKNDEYYTMLYLTDEIYKLTGYTKEEFLSTRISLVDIFHPDDKDYIFNEVNKKIEQKLPYHLLYRILHRNGYWVWIEEIGTGVWDNHNLLYLQGYLIDITTKKEEEERQKAKAERLILEHEFINEIIVNPYVAHGNFENLARIVTEKIAKKLKIPRVNIWLFNNERTKLVCIDHYELTTNLHFSNIILSEEDFSNEFETLKASKYVDAHNALEDHRTKGYAKNYLIPLDIKSMLDVGIRIGETNIGVLCFEYTGQKHQWEDDEITFACHIADQLAITFVNREKRKSEQRRDLLIKSVEAIEEGIIIANADGSIDYVNPAIKKLFGIDDKQLSNIELSYFFENSLSQKEYLDKLSTVKAGKTWRGQLELPQNGGSNYIVYCSISPLLNNNKQLANIVVIFQDITREIKLLNEYKQAQKMESIGLLAGGIAHDLNNHLMVIIGYAELAERELPSDSSILPYISEIKNANQKASNLVKQLLAFARKQILKKELIHINEVIENILNMLRRILKENIELNVLFAPDLPPIVADRNAIEIILMNLCVNANDAMPEGGEILVETRKTYRFEEDVKSLPWVKPGEFIVINISDTGIGMDKHTLEHCFDPFFTTKGPGKGTGLGLSSVYGLVQQHEGMIHVYSEVGKGTTFKIYLPITSEEAEISEEVREEESDTTFNETKTILIAEDEPAVRFVATKILEQAGYRVISAENGEEAMKFISEHINEIDLVILDVIMPKLGGKEVYENIKKIKPNLPVLFSTGYSENSIHANSVSDEKMFIISKPYGRVELLKTVRKILDREIKK